MKDILLEQPHIGPITCSYCNFKFYADAQMEKWPLKKPKRDELFINYLKYKRIAFPCPKCKKDIVFDSNLRQTFKYDELINKISPNMAEFFRISKYFSPEFVTMNQVQIEYEESKQFAKENAFTRLAIIIIKCYKTYKMDGYVKTYLEALEKMKAYGLISNYNIDNNTVIASPILKKPTDQVKLIIKQFADDILKYWQKLEVDSKGDSWYKLHERSACHDILTAMTKQHLIKDFSLRGIQYDDVIKEDHLTFQKFSDVLNEAPLPPDWDQTVYSPQVSFAKKIRYAVERAAKMGTGSSRVAFQVEYEGRPTILKIAKNKKGLAQNEKEGDYGLYRMYPDITVPLIDRDENDGNHPPVWLHVEKAEKLTESKFKAITGFSFNNFGDMLMADEARRIGGRVGPNFWTSKITPEEKTKIENSELYYNVCSLLGNFDMLAGDLTRLANWGIYQGHPVVIDIGFSSDVMKQHYSGK